MARVTTRRDCLRLGLVALLAGNAAPVLKAFATAFLPAHIGFLVGRDGALTLLEALSSSPGPFPGRAKDCTDATTGWTRFRGPNGSGIAPDSASYPAELSARTVRWRRAFPAGKSSPTLTDNAIFLTAAEGQTMKTLGVDRRSGKTLWERSLLTTRTSPKHALNHAAAATPVTDGHNVYAFFADFGLVSYDRDGRERWRCPLPPSTAGWGAASSPVMADGAVVLVADGFADSYIVALDQQTGKARWRVERSPLVHNYSTPILRSTDRGACELIVLGPEKVVSYDPRTGETRWTGVVPAASIIPTPVLHDGLLISSNLALASPPTFADVLKVSDTDGDGELEAGEYGQSDAVLRHYDRHAGNNDGKISAEEFEACVGQLSSRRKGPPVVTAGRLRERAGAVELTTEWTYPRNVPEVPSPLVYRGVLYTVANGLIVTSLNPATGERYKTGRIARVEGPCYSSPVAADGKVFVLSEDGQAAVLRASPQWDVLSVEAVDAPCYATPALGRGQVFVRTEQSLWCFGDPTPA